MREPTNVNIPKGSDEMANEILDAITTLSEVEQGLKNHFQKEFESFSEQFNASFHKFIKEEIGQDIKQAIETALPSSTNKKPDTQSNETFERFQNAQHELTLKIQEFQRQISQLSKQSQKSNRKNLIIGLLACSLTGSAIGFWIVFTQISPFAILLTDKKTKEAYEFGKKWMSLKEKRSVIKK